MKNILIINGAKESGKNTFINILDEISESLCVSYSSIDYIKDVAKSCFSWDGVKDAKGRKLLSNLKDAATDYNNLPLNKIIKEEESISNLRTSFIFCTCVREPPEIQKLLDFYNKDGYNALSVCIIRDSKMNLEESNHADTNIFDYVYDYYIDNNGSLVDLKNSVNEFYKELKV